MFEKLPSLREFQPKFYSGGAMRFHLPLLYDFVSQAKPKQMVFLGFGDSDAFFTACQAALEQNVDCQCVAVRRDRSGESEDADPTWRNGRAGGEEFYGERTVFFATPEEALAAIADGSVDVLVIDDSDSGTEIGQDLSAWQPKLSNPATVLLHGLGLERDDSPATAWTKWIGKRPHAHFPEGLGLGVATLGRNSPGSFLIKHGGDLAVLYSVAAARIDAAARATIAEKRTAAFETRQIWLDSLLTDRRKVQEIMDHQARAIASLEQRIELHLKAEEEQRGHFENLRRDRAKAQLVIESLNEQVKHFDNLRRDRAKAQLIMDSQHEQLKQFVAERDTLTTQVESLKAQLKEHKAILKAAKAACRKKGRCFQIQTGPKIRRPFGERVARELRRLPGNLGLSRKEESAPVRPRIETTAAQVRSADRYEAWIAEHEPDAAELEKQRAAARSLSPSAKISLLTPVHNTPTAFLEAMFGSVLTQTYDNWELCVVDAGSSRAETVETLRRWESRDQRIRVEGLGANLGIAENTNHALQMATGEFVACLDHDDVLAPFALFELARAAAENPEADIFYSDEDRLSEQGKRHAPFFKPEWDPELLCASMYIGHLSAYRRSLALELGGFRKEFDLSQDYDFALRATERARAIHHIPHVLYHWREHPESGSTGGKPDARRTNLAALADSMRRRNSPAEILEYPTANRARLKIERWPRVSIIVPTDSATRAQACLQDLPRATKYPDVEIVLVTNSQLMDSLKFLEADGAKIRLIPYDKPFNFSEKCNVGAEAATGERLIFFNDDVETDQADWIQNLIEPLENPEIGAVAPKLLYETGKIQHAGLVMGVRGLAGTAFHQRAEDSTEHHNLPQTQHDVAALSAACLAMRREDFFRVGGFDAVNTPIAHSDMDLCFKARDAGMRCVYTPYATLRHAGHASIGVNEAQAETQKRPRDKASIFLLKRWAGYTTRDPYFTDNMRDWLHVDSPTPIRMFGRNDPNARIDTSADLLFVSHDLSLSGAPMMLFHAAAWCKQHGMFVTVMAPEDGPLREKFETAGIPLIVDPLVEAEHESFAAFARDFDCVVANTIRTSAVVRTLKREDVPVVWWLHEPGSVGEHYLREEPKLRAAMPMADLLLAPSERTASIYRPYTESKVKCLHNAIPDVEEQIPARISSEPLRFLLMASVEPRKGQDVFVKALAQLPREVRDAAQFEIAGRILDPDFWPPLEPTAKRIKNLTVTGALSHADALAKMSGADVIVSPSRDEAMPTVTILEAMSLGRAIIASNVGGAAETFADGENALLVKPEKTDELATAIGRFIEKPELVAQLGGKARETYEQGFTIERFGPEFSEFIRSAISKAH
ncbi:MAG TPA: glycosyltransferase [Chthoniobacterales bacterium]|jgi:GT2 family glycosyltransferase|nr:glycosyltransferase [Chthoniobacterales bacterium]